MIYLCVLQSKTNSEIVNNQVLDRSMIVRILKYTESLLKYFQFNHSFICYIFERCLPKVKVTGKKKILSHGIYDINNLVAYLRHVNICWKCKSNESVFLLLNSNIVYLLNNLKLDLESNYRHDDQSIQTISLFAMKEVYYLYQPADPPCS